MKKGDFEVADTLLLFLNEGDELSRQEILQEIAMVIYSFSVIKERFHSSITLNGNSGGSRYMFYLVMFLIT